MKDGILSGTKKVMALTAALLVGGAAFVAAPGCSTAPKSEEKKDALHAAVNTTMERLKVAHPDLDTFLDNAHGYAIFPKVGKGGLIFGGAYGRGEVYERGTMIGHADISQATVGAQAGGQTFTEIIAFENQDALDRFKAGQLKFTAQASAVILQSGAAKSARYTDGVAIFIEPQAGAMVEAAVGGQSFSFQPT